MVICYLRLNKIIRFVCFYCFSNQFTSANIIHSDDFRPAINKKKVATENILQCQKVKLRCLRIEVGL